MKKLCVAFFLLFAVASLYAQSDSTKAEPGGFYSRWAARTNAVQSKQPPWAVPLVTTYTGLFQVLRTDFVRQITPTHTDTWNLDNSKAVNFIPWDHVEFAIDLPPFIKHNLPPPTSSKDGFGDFRSSPSTASQAATRNTAPTP